jgi:hypothetical protein
LVKVAEIEVLRVFHEATQWDKDGEVVLRSGGDTGRVYFAAGKIAWATSSTHDRTFTRYLVEHSPLSDEEVQEVYRECENTGKNLAETIIEWELLEQTTVRRLLLEQITEVMLEVLSWPQVKSMFMPEQRSYERVLTFEFAEVLGTLTSYDVDGMLPWKRTPTKKLLADLSAVAAKEKLLGKDGPLLPQQPRGSSRLVAAFLVFLLFVAAAAGIWFFRHDLFGLKRRSAPPPDRSAPTAAPPDAGAVADGASAPADAERVAIPVPDSGIADAQTDGPEDEDEGQVEPELPDGVVAFAPGHGVGRLLITSKPSRALIFLDGVATGKRTPAKLGSVPAGREHLIMLQRRGRRPVVKKLVLQDGQDKRLRLVLRKRGRKWRGVRPVQLLSSPSGAEVFYNGKSLKKKTPVTVKLPLSKASKIGLRLDGHKRWVHSVRPSPKASLSIYAELEPK